MKKLLLFVVLSGCGPIPGEDLCLQAKKCYMGQALYCAVDNGREVFKLYNPPRYCATP